MRTLALPKTTEPWSLTSLREKLIKIGAKVVSHGRYVTFQLAEVAVSRQMFADILSLIAQFRTPTRAGMRGAWSDLRQATAAEEMQANRRVYPLGAVGRLLLTDCCGPDARFIVVETPRKGDPRSQPPGTGGMSGKSARNRPVRSNASSPRGRCTPLAPGWRTVMVVSSAPQGTLISKSSRSSPSTISTRLSARRW
jgi:Transposase DDE domain group 1